jgi:hypothetical protein
MSAPPEIRAVDVWVNPMTPGAAEAPEFLKTVARDYFKREAEVFRGTPLDQIVAAIETAGVDDGRAAAPTLPGRKSACSFPSFAW